MTHIVENSLRAFRDRSGLSQQSLAERAGVTRQAIIAIEAGRQVPGTALALALARALGTSVGDLFRLGDPEALEVVVAPSASESGTGRGVAVGRVGDRWVAHRLPADEAMTADGVLDPPPGEASGDARVRPFSDPASARDRILVAGCAPLLEFVSHRLTGRFPDASMRWLPATSRRALDLLEAGLVHVAGIHLTGGEAGDANRDAVAQRFGGREMLVVNLTVWQQGLVLPPGNPAAIAGTNDLLRPGFRLVGREAGAGASELLRRLLRESGTATEVRTVGVASGHDEVARYVRYGAADAGIAIEGVAAARGLDFVPLTQERFDLVVPAKIASSGPVRRLLDFLDDPRFRDEVGRFRGYDGSFSGHVETVGA